MKIGRTLFVIYIGMFTSSVFGSVILDQSNVYSFPPGGLSVDSTFDAGQTFTVGVAGRLAHVDLQVMRFQNTSLPLFLDIRTTSGGLPTESNTSTLTTVSMAPTNLTVFTGGNISFPIVAFDVSAANIAVTPGEQLAITLRSANASSDGYIWLTGGQANDAYAAGSAVNRASGGTWQVLSGINLQDASFQTFVSVPEPASMVLLALPLLLAHRRKGRMHARSLQA